MNTTDKLTEELPPFPHHPEPHTHAWTALEIRAIRKYGFDCMQKALALIESEKAQQAEWPDVDDMAHSALQEALSFGLNHDVIARYGRSVLNAAKQAALSAASQQSPTIKQPLSVEQAEPVAWRTFDGEGGYDYMTYADNENYQSDFIARNGSNYVGWVEALYTAPQAAVPDAETVSLVTECHKALAEELSAWDIDPPLHHVAEAHKHCEKWLDKWGVKLAEQEGGKV